MRSRNTTSTTTETTILPSSMRRASLTSLLIVSSLLVCVLQHAGSSNNNDDGVRFTFVVDAFVPPVSVIDGSKHGNGRRLLFPNDGRLPFPNNSNNNNDHAFHTRTVASHHGALHLAPSPIDAAAAIPLPLKSLLLPAGSGTIPLLSSLLLNSSLFLLLRSKLSKVLTKEGYFHSLALGTLLWHTLGWKGWTTCVLYLGLGSLVTKVKFEEKERRGIAEGRGGRRGPENVWGSAATALLCAAASVQLLPNLPSTLPTPTFLGINYELYILGYVSALATKLSDTFASEIGKAYGKTTFLITTFERVDPGTEGAVSLEGTLAALFGGSLLPIYALWVGLIGGWVSVGIATLAAFLATNAESVIGAALQGKDGWKWMTNEVVNFVNTVIGSGIAIGLGKALLVSL